jgi:phosphoribosylaminoimidazole-succinocarboxamide synthase
MSSVTQHTIYLIDESYPDSSRYFYVDDMRRGKRQAVQKQLSKEFVRQWLIENGFQGKEGQHVPEMTDEMFHPFQSI